MEDISSTVRSIKNVELAAFELLNRRTEQDIPELEHMGARLYASVNVLKNLQSMVYGRDEGPEFEDDKEVALRKIRGTESKLLDLAASVEDLIEAKEQENRYATDDIASGTQGRPRKRITIDQLETLLQLGFSLVTIARLLGVSLSTVKRRKQEFDLPSETQKSSSISEEDLDKLVDNAVCKQPLCGIVMIQAEIRRQGIWIPRNRIRDSLIRQDPLLRSTQAKRAVFRRHYKVAAPNSLWHIDSNLKLTKKFGIVIHGAIDGYSRKILYLKGANNKMAATVEQFFLQAVEEYGWPTRIRTDKGGENAKIGQIITNKRPTVNKAHLVGSSCHNQRIERLWVDVRHCVTQLFMDLYDELVSCQEYNKDSPLDLFCAQRCFLPCLNSHLTSFIQQWNSHSLSTEHQKTPDQLYVSGIMLNARSNLLETNDILQRGDPEDVDMFYGVDAAGVLDDVAERNEMVPVADMHLTAQQNEQVDNIVDKSSRSCESPGN